MGLPRPIVKRLVNEIFEEEALLIGGLAATDEVSDDLVWTLMRNLDVIRGKALRRVDEGPSSEASEPSSGSVRPHPAVEEFLRSLRRG